MIAISPFAFSVSPSRDAGSRGADGTIERGESRLTIETTAKYVEWVETQRVRAVAARR